jgi:hypothetical protein
MTPEYSEFVEFCKKRNTPLSLTGNQQEFVEFLLKNEIDINKMGVTTKLFDIVTTYFLFKKDPKDTTIKLKK